MVLNQQPSYCSNSAGLTALDIDDGIASENELLEVPR